MVFCSLDLFPISGEIKSLCHKSYLHCSKSPSDSIHIFYKLKDNISHLIYDQNEELILKNDDEEINKIEYFDNDSEYLMLKSSYSIIMNEIEKIKMYIGDDDFFILKIKILSLLNIQVTILMVK